MVSLLLRQCEWNLRNIILKNVIINNCKTEISRPDLLTSKNKYGFSDVIAEGSDAKLLLVYLKLVEFDRRKWLE